MTDVKIGPDQGRLTLHTGVEGRAAKMGHALTILMNDWSGKVTLNGPEPTSLTLRASLSSLEVVTGEGGVKPLSDKDKRTVKASALETLAADAHPDVTFTSRAITAQDDGYAVEGDLSLNGRHHRAPFRWPCVAVAGRSASTPPSRWCRQPSQSSPKAVSWVG